MKVGIIVGSTRPGRVGASIGDWVSQCAAARPDATYEVLDLADFDLDLLNEPTLPGQAKRQYENPKTQRWSEAVDACQAFVFVTPEYNHSIPAAMKNAVDLLFPEWANKAVTFVGYGYGGALRSVEHWRGVTAAVFLQATRGQVAIDLSSELKEGTFVPSESLTKQLNRLLGQLEVLAAKVNEPVVS